MRKWLLTLLAVTFLAPCVALSSVVDDFSGLVGNISTTARVNLPGFKADVSAEFGIPVPRIDAMLAIAPMPGDVYMSLQIGKAVNRPPEEVIKYYSAHKDKGWGAIAKEMGIKPGSPEFHALKNGKYAEKAKGHKGGGEGGNGNDEKEHGNSGKGKGKKK